jgi:hypothetical protein
MATELIADALRAGCTFKAGGEICLEVKAKSFTVAELIAALQRLDPNAHCISVADAYYESYGGPITWVGYVEPFLQMPPDSCQRVIALCPDEPWNGGQALCPDEPWNGGQLTKADPEEWGLK